MSHQVVSLQAFKEGKQAHMNGQAICIKCRHTWEAIAPVGTTQLECPKCGAIKGIFRYLYEREEGMHWHCGCGNWYFLVSPEGIYCPNCGEFQRGFD